MSSGVSYKITRIQLSKVAGYLIHNQKNALLVDTGPEGSEKRILTAMKREGLLPDALKLIILTHAHFDHAGSALKLRDLTGAKVIVHQNDENYLVNGFSPIPGGTRWKAKILVWFGRLFARRIATFHALTPDILINREFNLEEYGFDGKIIHTPGHTMGATVVLMSGGEVIAGDTIFALEGKEFFPPFAEDKQLLLESWQKLTELPVHSFYPGHGRRISIDELKQEYQIAVQKYSKK